MTDQTPNLEESPGKTPGTGQNQSAPSGLPENPSPTSGPSEAASNSVPPVFPMAGSDLPHIFDAMPYGIMIMDQQKRIRMINKPGAAIMGFDKPGELVMSPCRDRICHLDEDNCPIRDRGKKDDKSECTVYHKEGWEVPILKHASPIILNGEDFVVETFFDITERKKKLQELSESKRQYASLLGHLPGLVFRCINDRNWTMEFLSDDCKDMTGYDPDDLIMSRKLSFNELVVDEDREKIWDSIQEKLNRQESYTVEYRIRTADGKIKWVWESGKGYFDPVKNGLMIEGFITDITEQKKAEIIQQVLFNISKTAYTSATVDEVFKSIHENLRQIIEAENFFIAIYDKKTDTISLPYQVDAQDKFASFPAGKTMTGYVIKTKLPLLANEPLIKELAQTGQIDIVGTPSKVWLGVPLLVAGEVIGVIVVQSYTDPKQYTFRELELLKFVADQIAIVISRKSIEESFQKEKAYLDQLFERSPEGIILIGRDGIVNKINPAFTRLFGFTSGDIIGQQIDDFIADPDNLLEAQTITRGMGQGELASLETRRRHKMGHLIDVSILVTPILINGEIIGGYGIYRDITDRKKIEKNLIAEKERAEESDRLKSAFLSNMSHEIRTPMNAILGFSTLLSDPGIGEEEKEEFLKIIKERGNDLMRIIDDIIDVAKIESGQIKIEIRECQVNQLLSNLLVTINEVKRKTAKTNIALNYLPGNTDKEFTILTDGNRLRQIMTNLVENSLKFTHEGYVEFGYTLKKKGDDPFIEFFVRDTGIGIPKDMHDTIFERFRQVDDTSTRKYGGTGLGLTISKNLVRLLGGDISVDSDRGKGAVFHVLLPLRLPVTKPSEVVLPVTPAPAASNWASKTILIVEDEDSNFFLLDRMLKKTGVKLIWARNGLESIEMCKKHKVDLVLMDIRMPVMDGYEATQILKKEFPSLPVIAQTAYALKGEKEKSFAAGCDNYVSKPIDSVELNTMLRKYLNL